MTFNEQIKCLKIEMYLSKLEECTFPQLLRFLVKAYGTRRMVSDETQIPYHRLEYLESGRNNKPPEEGELLVLGQYFGVESDLLRKKSDEYLLNKNTHCKHRLAM